jgi:hypothetical protein
MSQKKQIFNNVNVLGNFYLDDPDNLPERSFLTGTGTDRPIGFTQSRFARFFWTYRSFKCSAFGVLPIDQFGAFLAAGGTTGGIIGATAGIAAAISSNGVVAFTTNTRVAVVNRAKIRVTEEEINNGVTQGNAKIVGKLKNPDIKNPLELDSVITPNILGSFNNDVNEGSTSIGSYHFGFSNNGLLLIDFRDTVVIRNIYWPKIILQFGPSSGGNGPMFSSTLRITSLQGLPEKDIIQGGPWNIPVIGGITFDGGVIQMFGNNSYTSSFPTLGAAIINGSIAPNISNVCTPLNWDGYPDDARENYKKEECAKIFREVRSSSSTS